MAVKTDPKQSKPAPPKACVLVCYHKPSELVESQQLCPIHVGRALGKEPLPGMIGDDTGENISLRNRNFCESTAIYWAWKNVQADYYGLMHYRRVFDFTGNYPGQQCHGLGEKVQRQLGLNDEAIQAMLSDCDLLLPPKMNVAATLRSESVAAHYAREHVADDLMLLRQAVETAGPGLLEDYDAVMRGDQAYFFTMFVMRRELFHRFAEWMFGVFFELDKHIDFASRDAYQQRAYGFMGERMLTVFAHYCQRKLQARIKETPVVTVTDKQPLLGHAWQGLRRRNVRLKIRRQGMHVKLFGWEFRSGSEK